MDLQEKVIAAMEKADKPLRPGEIAELSGLNKSDVEKAIKKLKEDDLIESPKRCFWALK